MPAASTKGVWVGEVCHRCRRFDASAVFLCACQGIRAVEAEQLLSPRLSYPFRDSHTHPHADSQRPPILTLGQPVFCRTAAAAKKAALQGTQGKGNRKIRTSVVFHRCVVDVMTVAAALWESLITELLG